MSFIKNCSNCHASHSELTPLYFCCDSQRLLCRRCKPIVCPVCRRSSWKEIKERACKICKKRLNENEGLREEICGELYCPRCIAHLFLPYYLSKEPPLIVELRCGHFKDKLDIEAVLIDYCISCGFRFREALDFELQDEMKLCSFCFGYEGRKFEDFFQRCLNCCKILKSKEGVLCFDLLLCKPCSESQTMIEQSIVHSNFLEGKQPSATSELRSQKLAPFKEKMEEEQPSQQLSIVSRFSAFQIDEEEKKKGKVSTMRILSKNSVEIRVENFQLPPIVISQVKMIRCQLCSSVVPFQGTLTNTTHSNTRICKICYTQTFDKSYITYTRYNNYTNNEQRTTSLPKNAQTNKNTMKMSMLPQGSTLKESQPARQLFQAPIINKIERKQAWEIESAARNLCELCNSRSVMIIRADKKRVCVQCRNKHG